METGNIRALFTGMGMRMGMIEWGWEEMGIYSTCKFPHKSYVNCVLCIPATSAACERVFSVAGRTLEKHRTSLSSGTVNSLFFCIAIYSEISFNVNL